MPESASTDAGIRLAFFGNFYPSRSRLGPHSAGLVMTLSQSSRVRSVKLFTTLCASAPRGLDPTKVTFERCWNHDSPLSLVRALLRILKSRRSFDAIIFNVFPTSFGRNQLANVIGMCLPIVVSKVGRAPVVVYIHNTAQTEDFTSLGYHPPALVLWGLDRLMGWLGRATTLVTPLSSQSVTLNKRLGLTSRSLFLPYVEAVPLLAALNGTGLQRTASAPDSDATAPLRLLFFGSWGPQKDLNAISRVISHLNAQGISFDVRFGGSINPTFPETKRQLTDMISRVGLDDAALMLDLPDATVAKFMLDSPTLLVSYRAAGGPSGVMNTAAMFDLPVVSSDLPELRETAALTGLRVTFVSPDDDEGVLRALLDTREIPSNAAGMSLTNVEAKLDRLRSAVDRLLDIVEDRIGRRVSPTSPRVGG